MTAEFGDPLGVRSARLRRRLGGYQTRSVDEMLAGAVAEFDRHVGCCREFDEALRDATRRRSGQPSRTEHGTADLSHEVIARVAAEVHDGASTDGEQIVEVAAAHADALLTRAEVYGEAQYLAAIRACSEIAAEKVRIQMRLRKLLAVDFEG